MGQTYPFGQAVAIGGLASAGPDMDVVGLLGFRVFLGRGSRGFRLAGVAFACVLALLCDPIIYLETKSQKCFSFFHNLNSSKSSYRPITLQETRPIHQSMIIDRIDSTNLSAVHFVKFPLLETWFGNMDPADLGPPVSEPWVGLHRLVRGLQGAEDTTLSLPSHVAPPPLWRSCAGGEISR